ncbi:hypothetical protein DAI22_04g213100 [Oryza sativa Japonica Group]|nr:hypothetical protein DAI22_04g213100 [Oryza sativa Japonica Group]
MQRAPLADSSPDAGRLVVSSIRPPERRRSPPCLRLKTAILILKRRPSHERLLMTVRIRACGGHSLEGLHEGWWWLQLQSLRLIQIKMQY